MNVVPFHVKDARYGALPTAAHAQGALASALAMDLGIHREPQVAFPLAFSIRLAERALACSAAASTGLVATGLFVRRPPYGLLPVGQGVARRLDTIAARLGEGCAVSAVLTTVTGEAFIADAMPAVDEAGVPIGIVLLRPLKPAPWTVDDLAERFGMTQREADVTLGLLHGLPVPAIATRLSLRAGTVRQYLKSIYAKTGTCNQAQLLALLNGGLPTADFAEYVERE